MPKKLPYTFQESLGYGGKKADEDKALKILQRVGIDAISNSDETPIEVAAYLENINLLKTIIEKYKSTCSENEEVFSKALSKASENRALKSIQILIDEGANIEYLNKYSNTPLSNVFINTFSDPIPSAKYLIKKGAKITERVLEMGMSWDSEEFTTLLDDLGIEFDGSITPEKENIEPEVKTDIDIIHLHNTINNQDYNKTAKVIWEKLVPASGQADTIQGELLRAIEKLRDEAQRNGNINFNKNCHGILIEYLRKYLTNEAVFDEEVISQIKKDLKIVSHKTIPYTEDDVYDNITKRIVDWYLKKPTQLSHKKNKQLYC